MTHRVKPFTTIDEQINALTLRGLTLDHAVAGQWLRNIGYYRLSGYWYPYHKIDDGQNRGRLDHFTSGANFDDVVKLYEFDRKLRTLIHDGIERVEITLRSHLGYLIGSNGPLAYRDRTMFRPSFDHPTWLAIARTRADRARRHSDPIRHHEVKYGGELPIWVLTEVLDFTDVSKLYDGLRAREQWMIAEQLGVNIVDSALSANQRKKARKAHPLARWFEHLTVLRNTCAHHTRVWNRSFTPVSTAGLRTMDRLRSLPEGQSERLYGALIVMGHLLQGTSPGTTWMWKMRTLIDDSFIALPGRTVAEMGFPDRWREEQLWSRPPQGLGAD
ncbi:Abi family protein [Glutamicibacter uratoxydans]|uniref:Abi family protein n=1 Tax=Glutamicibacter uratoxydans TaxID=43667 RepID=UPI003D6E5AD9